MKYKAIALDLDGTLKSSDKTILPKTKEKLMELADQGVKIILASGRPTAGMKAEAKELELEKLGGYIVSFNGARVIDCKENTVIYEKVFSKEVAREVYQQAKKFNFGVLSYEGDVIISEDVEDEYIKYEGELNHMELRHVKDFKATIQFPVNKVLLTGEPTYVEKHLDAFKKPFGDSLSIYRSAPFFIEVMDQGIDKAQALDVVLQELAISKEELIAFGDGYNDLGMLRFAGKGVAMGNAVEEVKQEVEDITASNDDEGIAKFLERMQKEGKI